jgi:hypothetical protein
MLLLVRYLQRVAKQVVEAQVEMAAVSVAQLVVPVVIPALLAVPALTTLRIGEDRAAVAAAAL